MSDPFDLQRFVDAQQPVIERVQDELREGRKRSHWMWFVFPQIAGLGHSDMARRYAINSREEALAYLAHPVLGPRLEHCTALANSAPECVGARDLFGTPDDLKFRSSMTLFAEVAPGQPLFTTALVRYFNAEPDAQTLLKLGAHPV